VLKERAMDQKILNALKQVADGVAVQFGNNCEVAIYDPAENSGYSVVYAVNEHVSGQSFGTQENRTLLEKKNLSELKTRGHLSFMVKTPEGRVLKNSAVCIRNEKEEAEAVVTIRYDVTELVTLENAIHDLISTESVREKENEPVLNVNELLEQLIQKSVELVGKPVKLMNKDDKIKAIQFLSRNGAFLVTKSGDKVAKYFGISKYTLYSCIDAKSEGK
jgi:predicted transcriptional regulator YheO